MRRTPLRRRAPLQRHTPLRQQRSLRATFTTNLGRWACSRRPRWAVLPCGTCGAPVKRPWHRRHKPAFCCVACAAVHHSGPRHPQHRRDILPPLPADWKTRAERIRKRDGYRCQDCGKTQRQSGNKLHVDHIWPRRWFPDPAEASEGWNLTCRCNRCHGRKTAGAERKLLRGDLVAFRRYLASVQSDGEAIPYLAEAAPR